MELSTYLQILFRRIWVVLATTFLVVLLFQFGRSFITETYEATTLIRIVPYTSSNPSYTTLVYADRIMNTYIKIASSSLLIDQLRENLGLGNDRPTSVDVTVLPESELLQIKVEDTDPVLARDAANNLAGILLNEKPIRDIRIYIVEPADLPAPPSPLRNILYSALGLVVGLVGGVGLAFLIENLDQRVHSTEQIEALTGLPIIEEIPTAGRDNQARFLIDTIPYSDVFRRIQVSILSLANDRPLETLMITSAIPSEGKSTVTANLARSMAKTGRKVVVVDADLYYPTMHEFFELPNEVGFSTILQQDGKLTEYLQNTQYPNIEVLTSGSSNGSSNSNSAELLGSGHIDQLLERLKKQFDIVLIDAPALLGVADTLELALHVDGVVMIARYGSVKAHELKTTCQQLDRIRTNLIGVIVNQTIKNVPNRYYRRGKG